MEPSTTPTPEQNQSVAPESAPDAVSMPEPAITPGITPSAFSATEPVTAPTQPKPADPVEEELKAPLKAAEPVPGSIGSAISVPAADGASVGVNHQTPSVAFNDPAMQQNLMAPVNQTRSQKKMSNTTMVLLVVLGVAIIAVLVVVLIKLLTQPN